MTVVADRRRPGEAAELVLATAFLPGIDVVGHEEIEVAVAIDVQKGTTGTPQIGIGAGGVRDLGKPSLASIAIQLIRADAGHIQVDQAVIVVVAGAGTHAVLAVPDARRRGHVLEGSIAAVPVHAVTRSAGNGDIGHRAAVHQEDVEPAVIVEVEEETARPHDLGKEPVFAGAVDVHEVESDSASDIAEHRKADGGTL